MDKLISLQAAIDALCKSECGWNNAECRHKDGTDFCVTCDNVKIIKSLPSVQPERKDALEKAVAVEAISDELMSRFDVSATYGYDFAEAVINRMEAMAKELERGEQE